MLVVKPQSDILSVTLACLQKGDCQSDGQLMLADKIKKDRMSTIKKFKKNMDCDTCLFAEASHESWLSETY